MKGVSVLVTIVLLVAAQQLALHLKRARTRPARTRSAAGLSVPSGAVYQL